MADICLLVAILLNEHQGEIFEILALKVYEWA